MMASRSNYFLETADFCMYSGCEPGIRSLSGQVFLPSCKLFFLWRLFPLQHKHVFNLVPSHLSSLLLFPEMLATYTGSCRLCRCPEVFPSCISIAVSKVQALKIFMSHLYKVRDRSCSICGYQSSQHLFLVKDAVFSPTHNFGTFVKKQSVVAVWDCLSVLSAPIHGAHVCFLSVACCFCCCDSGVTPAAYSSGLEGSEASVLYSFS